MLKVWLPLDGDLHNQGISDYTITAIEASPTFTTGKIGQCYQRTNTSSQITNGLQIQDNLLSTFGTTASVAVWVKPLGTHTHYNGTILSSGNWNSKRWAFGVSQDNSQVDVLCGGYNNYISCTVPINQWTHLVSTFNNGICKLYKNGIYIGEKTGQATFNSDANWTGICRETYAGGYFGFNGCINDLRIYDHCLSAAEVKEIAQGLVLHYKLDTYNLFNPNTLTQDIYLLSNGSTSTSGAVGNWALTEYIPVKPNTTYIGYNLVNGGNGSPSICYYDINKTYTRGAAIMANTPLNITTQNNEYYVRISIRKTNNNINKMSFFEIPAYIQDSSGYNHNGTINSTIQLSSDTPRYTSAAYFGTYNAPNVILSNASILPALNNCTITWWGKYDTTKTLLLTGQSTSHYIGASNNNNYYHSNAGSPVMYKDGVPGTYKCAADGWHFFALTGVDISTWTTLKINGYSSGWPLKGYISDFRIYCTPLLDTDIKQLYNVGMKVDKSQNIHTFEINEKNINIFSSTPWTNNFNNHSPNTNPFTNYNSNNEPQFTTNSSSAGSDYIVITPGIYEWDYTVSINAGNQFYIGFERYDADKTSRSNAATVYQLGFKPSEDLIKRRFFGTVNLSTDGVNPIKYIALRILNGWSGTTSGVTGQATIHNFSLRLQSAAISPKIIKAGQLIGDEFKEYLSAKFYKDHIIEANQFIER